MVKKKGKKMTKYEELIESKMYKEFEECHPEFRALIDNSPDGFEDKGSFLEWAEDWYYAICSPDELDWVSDMLYDNPKEVYRLRGRIKYRLDKWLYNKKEGK